jgi:hypothetical protein
LHLSKSYYICIKTILQRLVTQACDLSRGIKMSEGPLLCAKKNVSKPYYSLILYYYNYIISLLFEFNDTFFITYRKLLLISMITKNHPLAKMLPAIAAYVSRRHSALLHLVALVHIKLNIYQKILQLLVSW